MVDVPKSLAAGRINLGEEWLDDLLEIVLWAVAWPYLTFIATVVVIIDWAQSHPISPWLLLIALGTGGLGIVVTYWRTKLGRLIRLPGKNWEKNLDAVQTLSAELGWTLERHSAEYFLLKPPPSFWSGTWGTTLYVLFDKNDVFLAVLAFARQGVKSPLHYLDNRRIERMFTRRLTEILAQSH